MKKRRYKRTADYSAAAEEPKVTARRIQMPERDLPGHPISIAVAVAVALAAILAITLSSVQVTAVSIGSWTLFA